MDIILDGLNEHDKTDGLQVFREELDDVKNHLKTVSVQVKQIQGNKADGTHMVQQELDDMRSHLQSVSVLVRQIRRNQTDVFQVVQKDMNDVKNHLRSDVDFCKAQVNALAYIVGDVDDDNDATSIAERIERLEMNFISVQAELYRLRNAKSIAEDLGQRLNALGADVMGIVNNTASVLELDTVRSNVETISESVTLLQQQVQSQSGNINSQQLDKEVIAIRTNLETIDANCNQLSVELDNKAAKDEINSLKNNFSVVVNNLTKVEAVLIQMQESQGNTVQYSEELSNQISQMENLRQDVNLMQVHIDQMSQDIRSRATVADVTNIRTSVSGLRAEVTSEVKAINQRIDTLRQGTEDNSEYINTLMQDAEDNSRRMNNVVTKGEVQSIVAVLRQNFSDIFSQARGNFSDIRQEILTFKSQMDSRRDNHKTMIRDFLNLRQEFVVLQQREQREQTGSDVIIGEGQWTGSAALGQLLRNVSLLNHEYRMLNASHGVIQVDLDILKRNSAQLITDVSDLQRDRDNIRNDIRAIRYDLDRVTDKVEDIR